MNKPQKQPSTSSTDTRPNILFIMSDEYRFPRYFKTPEYGMAEPIKHILGFQGGPAEIEGYAKYFPGFVRLRQNAVVLRQHTIASSACIPSRATIFTGQYGALTGVTQTDGVFKEANSHRFPWLQPDGIPTMGDWFRANGYETHYFGKCHFADPPHHSIEEFGFDDWEMSYPEPHGSELNNLGLYRDYGFTDLVTTFLRGKGLALAYDRAEAEGRTSTEADTKPWLAVASFTNPHDITTFPMLVGKAQQAQTSVPRQPLEIPTQGARSAPPERGTWQVELNPDGFPQDCANVAPNWDENLRTNNKPDCQYDYSLKLGIALASKSDKEFVASHAPGFMGLPFQLTSDPQQWSEAYMQYYTYLHYALDQHIDRVLRTLHETGLSDNTIVVFVPDHGEYGAAHGMMLQKWHSAYQEALHVPVVFCLPPSMQSDTTQNDTASANTMRQIDEITSHIDLIPTLLGLVGVSLKDRNTLAEKLDETHVTPDLVGADLSDLITGKSRGPVRDRKGKERQGVLFTTDDLITQPLPGAPVPESYNVFLHAVNDYIGTDNDAWAAWTSDMAAGPVRQPCHVRCVRQKEWKLAQYFDPSGQVADQWEMYHLDSDPDEMTNLLVYNGAFPTAIEGGSMGKAAIESKARELRASLDNLVEEMLTPRN